eukprot:TRINITY_DN21732_c0_g1_i1.p1 TRINITY_DN21732_c0_g1~~TRINITY_DN21732_c0_g1_i1.p1  ORF type:complete len:433 (-),score=58.47 TRINITY_DN21732_c0_g1_i1:197-1444(-)
MMAWTTVAASDDVLCVIVPKDVESVTLPEALVAALPETFTTSSMAKRACRNKGGRYSTMLPNGAPGRCESVLKGGDTFKVVTRSKVSNALDIVYEDDDVVVVRKPAGQNVHGDGPSSLCTLLSQAMPGAAPCHRLDAPTEGLLVVGRTGAAKASLAEQFREREVCKKYVAVVHGRPKERSGTIRDPIDGQESETYWEVRWQGHSPTFGPLASLALSPKTGRKHQLRRHLAESLGWPIVGDVRYVPDGMRTLRGSPLLLAALEVSFEHPVSAERVTASIEEPKRFTQFELLPGADVDPHERLAAVIKAGQRQSPAWKEAWAAYCASLGSDAGGVGAIGGKDCSGAAVSDAITEDSVARSFVEKDPKKRRLCDLRTFLLSRRDAGALADTPWIPLDLLQELELESQGKGKDEASQVE